MDSPGFQTAATVLGGIFTAFLALNAPLLLVGLALGAIVTHWKDIKECSEIDLLRGFKSPYWGYYAVTNDMVELQAKAFYKKRVSKVMNAKTDDELCKVLDYQWNFFKCDDHNEINLKFGILDYIIDSKGEFTILGVSEYKTLAEHQEDLRRKYKK